MSLSHRLKVIAELVTAGNTAADIGTDHGYVPVYLLRSGISPQVIASDISEGSLSKARKNAVRFHLEDKMECRISDGLKAYVPGEADTCIISGMGGILITDILTSSEDAARSFKEFILSPQRNPELVRECLAELGFKIVYDEVLEEKGKKYVIIKAVNTAG